jgi:hypothetical protein
MSGRTFLSTRPVRIAVAVVIVALAVMWIYVLFIAKPEPTDRLTDRSFPTAAQPICKATIDNLRNDGLLDQKASSPQDRASLADRADAQLADMVAQLRAKVPASGVAHDATTAWLDDWDQWLHDRAAWTDQLKAGQDVQFYEKQRGNTGEPNSTALNAFAVTNEMSSCQTPSGL